MSGDEPRLPRVAMLALPDGRPLHVWLSGTGMWACAAYDHGPMCRRCVRVADFRDVVKDTA
jgi:hypothetical protein